MKSKKGLIILVCTLLIGCLALTACGGGGDNGGGDHTHTYGTTWKYNATQHWHECDCGDKKDTANHTYSGNSCTACGYEQGGQTTAEKKPASDYFSGAKLSFVNNAIADTALGGTKDFHTLLERQIDAVAQELLVRLGKVYGQVDADLYQVKDCSQDFTGLTVTKDNLIIEPTMYNGAIPVYARKAGGSANTYGGQIDLDDAATYAYLISTGNFTGSLSDGTFNFRNVIKGGYTHNGTQFTNSLDEYLQWTMRYTGTFDLNDWVSTNLETVKRGIANAIAGTSTSYAEAKKAITSLGFTSQNIDSIISYVNTSIIGTAVVNADTASKPSVNTVSYSTELTNIQHTFKNYEVIIPAIVNSIANQKVQPSGNSAYFSADKNAVTENATLTDSNNSYEEYTSIALKVKAGTPITKLEMRTATNQSGIYAYRVKAKIGSTTVDVTPVDFCMTSSPNGELFTIDLAAKFPSLAGTTLSQDSTIELTFEAVNISVPFRVEFTGYWSA